MANLVEGWTVGVGYLLKADGAVVDLTGMTVEVQIYDRSRNLLTPAGSVSITNAAGGAVSYEPGDSELSNALSPYYVRFKVTDGSGKIAFFPNGEAERWYVRKP